MSVRLNVLSYASPTTSHFLVFLAALVTSGAFVGTWLHNEVEGREWTRTVARCAQASAGAGPDLQAVLAGNAAAERCRASVERQRAAYSFAGAGGALALGVVVALLAPAVIERRRRLRRAGPRLADTERRMSELAREAGLRRPPLAMLGPSTQRDAFAYGFPGRYRVALPPAVAVRWRDVALFDPLVRHELAHVAHRDVALAWLARSIWYVIAPLLALPIVAGAVSGDLSLAPDYVWRAALLALAVQLVSAALLRSREHDADLRAAQTGGPGAIAGVLGVVHDHPARFRPLARHPSRTRRLAVLERPELTARVTLTDGLTAAFLAALSIPLIVTAVTTLLIGSGHLERAQVVAAVLTGPLLGGSVGLGLCRAALIQRAAGTSVSPAPAALGVAIGLVLGHAASLAQTGVGSAALGPPAWMPLLALLGAGATVLAAGLGQLLADAAPLLRRARAASLIALVTTSLVFAAALWVGLVAEMPLTVGAALVKPWLVSGLASWLVLSACVAIAAVATLGVWASRRARPAPAWIVEHGATTWDAGDASGFRRALTVGLTVGAGCVLTLCAWRLLAGPATDLEKVERFEVFVWMAALASALALAALASERRRLGAGTLGAAVACVTTIAGYLAWNVAYGSTLDAEFVSFVAKPAVALSFVAIVLLAPLSLVSRRALPGPVTGVVVLACAAALVAGRAAITVDRDLSPALPVSQVDTQLYVTSFAPDVANRYLDLRGRAPSIGEDPERAVAIADGYRALLGEAEAYVSSSDDVRDVHEACVAALAAATRVFDELALGLRTGDQTAFERAEAAQVEEQREMTRWHTGVLALRDGP